RVRRRFGRCTPHQPKAATPVHTPAHSFCTTNPTIFAPTRSRPFLGDDNRCKRVVGCSTDPRSPHLDAFASLWHNPPPVFRPGTAFGPVTTRSYAACPLVHFESRDKKGAVHAPWHLRLGSLCRASCRRSSPGPAWSSPGRAAGTRKNEGATPDHS